MNMPSLNSIINGDCLKVMRGMPDKCIDLVLTDPPYGLNDKMKGGTWGTNSIYKEMLVWDNVISQEYFDEMYRVSKNQIIWGGNYYTMPPSRCWLAWIKKERMDTLADFELAWTSFDKLAKSFDERRNPDGKRNHPTQKPLELLKWCIQFADKHMGGVTTILDPFLGSGTTAVACKQLKRNFIGIEISKEYCAIAESRLAAQPSPMF